MRFTLRKLTVIDDDLRKAGRWYEKQAPGEGLPQALIDEVDTATALLRDDALVHRIRFRDVRRAPLKRFAFYGIYYVVRQDRVVIIAVFHDRRHPGRLRQRRREVEEEL